MRISLRHCTGMFYVFSLLLLPATKICAETANPMPSDLQQLLRNFEKTPKNPQAPADLFQVQGAKVEEGKSLAIGALAMKTIEAIEGQSAVVTHILATSASESVRKDILKILLPGKESQQFCEVFAYKEFTPKPGERLSDDQLKVKKDQFRLAQCRKQAGAVFGGIFYASPKVVLLNIKYRQGEADHEQLQVYVPSMLDAKQMVSYRIKVK